MIAEKRKKYLIPFYNHILKNHSFNKINEFAEAILSLEIRYKVTPLQDCGVHIIRLKSFNIDELTRSLSDFPEIKKNISGRPVEGNGRNWT